MRNTEIIHWRLLLSLTLSSFFYFLLLLPQTLYLYFSFVSHNNITFLFAVHPSSLLHLFQSLYHTVSFSFNLSLSFSFHLSLSFLFYLTHFLSLSISHFLSLSISHFLSHSISHTFFLFPSLTFVPSTLVGCTITICCSSKLHVHTAIFLILALLT